MIAKYVQDGKYIDYIPTADIDAGAIVIISDNLIGIATQPIPAGNSGAICTEGVFEVAKDTSTFSAGAAAYFSGNIVTVTSSNATLIGVAIAEANETDETVRVKLG